MTLYPSQDSFVRGEISPRLHSRASLDLYRSALASCVNFVTLPHGGVRKRGGTRFVGSVKIENKITRGIPFKFSEKQAYWLEFGDFYVRVYAYGGYVTEFAAPWAHTQVQRLQYTQSGDVMWVVHPDVPPQMIIRTSNTDWSVSPLAFTDGPFGPVNTQEGVLVSASGTTGAITLNANNNIFSPSDVGRLFRIEMESYGNIDPWSPGAAFADQDEEVLNKTVRYEGNVYRSLSSGSSSGTGGWRYGATPPTHTKGFERDGPTVSVEDTYQEGVIWEYMHSGFGVARITSYIDGATVNADVVSQFPAETVGGNARYLWAFGAIGPGSYPVAVSLFEERLFFASKLSVYGSKTGDFESFSTGEKDDDGLEFLLAANEANEITWLADADGFLAIGTIGGVRALSGSGIDEALTPSSFKNRSSATARCSYLTPMNTGQAFLYVNGGELSASEMVVGQNGRFESADVFQISEHIPKVNGKIQSAAYQEYPDSVAWFAMLRGELCGFTYQRDQEVRGMHRHRIGGSTNDNSEYAAVRDVAVTPGQNAGDDVWLIVDRKVNGVMRRYIEIMTQPFEYGEKDDAVCLDSSLTYNGVPVNLVSGLSHLEGEAVEILADGSRYEAVVAGGAVSLPAGVTAATITVGVPFVAEAETLELDVGGKDGSIMGRPKRVVAVYFSVLETDVSRLEVSSKIKKRWEKAKLNTHAPDDDLFTGVLDPVGVDDSWAGQAKVRFRHSGPKPCTVRAMIPAFDAAP